MHRDYRRDGDADKDRDLEQHVALFHLRYPRATRKRAVANFCRMMERQTESKNRGFARQGNLMTTPDEVVRIASNREKLQRIMAKLTPFQNKLAYLLGIQGLTKAEAARVLGVHVSTVWQALLEARKIALAEDFQISPDG